MLSDPVNFNDPEGKLALNAAGAIGGLVSGAYGAYMSSGGDLTSMTIGAFTGAAIGAVNPFGALGSVGSSFASNFSASVIGQAIGNYIDPKIGSGINYTAATFAGAGGVVGLPVKAFTSGAINSTVGNMSYGMTVGLGEAAGFSRCR